MWIPAVWIPLPAQALWCATGRRWAIQSLWPASFKTPWGGELFQIETVQQYPLEHEPLVDLAAEEQDAGARPELSSHMEDPGQYDVIFLGYPNWWGDMPQALYTFLEEYDFSGKTIIPFTTHGGSGFSRTISTIAELQPGANVVEQGLSISRNSVTDAQSDVENWVAGLGF